jgi:hypothetical protein
LLHEFAVVDGVAKVVYEGKTTKVNANASGDLDYDEGISQMPYEDEYSQLSSYED